MRRTWLSLLSIPLVAGLLGMAPAAAGAEPFVLLGIYPYGILQDPNAIGQIQDIDTWLATPGRRIGIAGDFMALQDPAAAWNVPHELNGAWNAGYIPFVNLMVNQTSSTIASGGIDTDISAWAAQFATWAKNGTGPVRRAFLAPLPEVNFNSIPYYVDGAHAGTFIAAYRHIRQLFAAELQKQGVPATAISWVFAPNGFGNPGDELEKYYPGHADVDIVAFSSYNYAGCIEIHPWVHWETFDTMLKPYLDRMSAMAPGKPIFISQMGTFDKAVPNDPSPSNGNKDLWLQDSYTRLAAYPRLRAVIYYNLTNQQGFPNCANADYRVHIPGTAQWQGFKSAATDPNSNFGYWAPTSPEVTNIVFAPTAPLIFADVFPIHPFAVDTGETDFSPWIYTLYNSGITTGCATNPLQFCPADTVTRAQMAVFLLKAIHGAAYVPPAGTGTVFADVPASNAFVGWIEQLSREGITGGCANGNYCPNGAVTRAQMAVFLLKSKHGAGYTPPAAQGNVFSDVPASNQFVAWIERLAAEGITGGCGGSMYCPNASVTRQQMAVFLVRTFNL